MTPSPLIPTLSLQVTYQCNIECRHCGPMCGPRERDWMSDAEICGLFEQASDAGAHNVVFTGGEPSLLGARLPELLRFLKTKTRIPSARIVTNAKWATSRERARRVLAEWMDAGLDEVNISCGEYHQELVPIKSVVTAYEEAIALGYSTVLLCGEFLAEGKGRLSPADFERAAGYALPPPLRGSPYRTTHRGLVRGMVTCSGRGAVEINPDDTVQLKDHQFRTKCKDVFSAITAHPNGKVTACCGVMVREASPIDIGNWRTHRLADIVSEARQDLILNWIKYLGLRDMKAWLQDKDSTLRFKDSYAGICDLCQDIMYNKRCRDILLTHGSERAPAVEVNRLAQLVTSSPDFVYATPDMDTESDAP